MTSGLSARLAKLEPQKVLRSWLIWLDKNTDVHAEKARLKERGMTDSDKVIYLSWEGEE